MNSIIFKALGSETRLKIIKTLMIKEHNVTDLTKISGKDQTTVSRHLANLREAKLIAQRKIGRSVIYTISNSQVIWRIYGKQISLLKGKLEEMSSMPFLTQKL